MEGQNISYDSLQDIGQEYDENQALELCETMKKIALGSCETKEEKAAIKDVTIAKLHDMGLLCMIGRNLYPTHAFNLMTVNTNKAAKIQCALFKGNTRDIFIDRKEFAGPIYEQIDNAYNFVLRHIDMGARIDGEYRIDMYELPISAVRETIANAVLHRSYLDRSCVQVCIYDDRMEVSSPGMLYGGLDIETAKTGKSTCRNEAIAEAFHYMHIVEAWGTGIPRIINRCNEYNLPAPVFEEFGDGFKVTLFRRVSNATEKVSNTLEKVSNIPEKVGNATKKVSNTPEKVGNATKKVSNTPEKVSNKFDEYLFLLKAANVTDIYVNNIRMVYEHCGADALFGQANVMEWLGCSKSKATNIMNALKKAEAIEKVKGHGSGRYRFVNLQD